MRIQILSKLYKAALALTVALVIAGALFTLGCKHEADDFKNGELTITDIPLSMWGKDFLIYGRILTGSPPSIQIGPAFTEAWRSQRQLPYASSGTFLLEMYIWVSSTAPWEKTDFLDGQWPITIYDELIPDPNHAGNLIEANVNKPYFDGTVVFTGGKGTLSLILKPTVLAPTATNDDAIAKLIEIIAYCDKRSGNEATRTAAATMKINLETAPDNWSTSKATQIPTINEVYIGGLK